MSKKITMVWHDVSTPLGQPKRADEIEEVDALELANAMIQGQRDELKLRRAQVSAMKQSRDRGLERGKKKISDKTSKRDRRLVALARRFVDAMGSYERVKLRDLLNEFAIAIKPDAFNKADLLRFLKRYLRLTITTKRISQILDQNGVEIQ